MLGSTMLRASWRGLARPPLVNLIYGHLLPLVFRSVRDRAALLLFPSCVSKYLREKTMLAFSGAVVLEGTTRAAGDGHNGAQARGEAPPLAIYGPARRPPILLSREQCMR